MAKISTGRHEEPDTSSVSESDISRQAELVVMEYLKSARCSKTLDAMMSHGAALSAATPVSSELYAEDLDRKKKTVAKSVLEYVVSIMEKNAPTDSVRVASPSTKGSARRRSSRDESGDEKASAVGWTREEVHLLKKAIKHTSEVDEKNERWRQIANFVGNGKSKKHCYLKYKELKEEKSSSSRSKSPSSEGRSSSRRPSASDENSGSEPRRSSSSGRTGNPTVEAINPAPIKVTQSEEDLNLQPAMTRVPLPSAKQPTTGTRKEVLAMEDCEDFDSTFAPASRAPLGKPQHLKVSQSLAISGRAPSADEVEALRGILFPDDRRNFSSHWEEQPTPRDQEQAIVCALSHVIWQAARASRRSECLVVLNDDNISSTASSKRKFMGGMVVFTTKSAEQIQSLLSQHVRQFTAPKSNGLVLLVLSVVLTKGIGQIVSEMDSVEGALGGGGKLIGGHDYCTQEIVNLLLCGVASSNVFDGKQLLDGSSEDDPKAVVLKGIPTRCDVGFLSLFEAYEYIVVGSHVKMPRFNIFVVCSESHYSILFADPKLLTSNAIHGDELPQLDMFYFDGLGNQDEEIRLTVHTTALQTKPKAKPDDLIPPLNLVLQTKWPRARIDWNGVDPLL